MQRRHVVGAAVLNFLLCLTAFSQAGRPVPPVRPVRPAIAALPGNGNVVIYEQKNFTGRSETLAAGDHRLTDWKPASIQVPAGLVAYLYESVDSSGGYGISVDLMEDHRDLSEFGLNGNVSFISVFPSTRQGFIWARNSMSNGQFVAGHWERSRAAGNPVNTVAVASSPLPSRTPAAPTSIQQQGATWTIATLGLQSPGDAAQWNHADPTMGVIGSDFRGPQEIGSAKFQRASNNALIPDWIEFWYPNKQPNDHRSIVYFKRTLTGVITDTITKNWSGPVPDGRGGYRTISGTYELSEVPHVANISGTYPDFDVNIDVAPFADYTYLINDSHKPERSTEVSMKDLVDSDHDPCTDPFIKVEAEIDSGNVAKQSIVTPLLQRVGKQIAMYGPWIYDIGHCDHPEIHPAEEIWWTENAPNNGRVYHLNLFADSSKRFWWRSQMDDGTKLHPWGAPPITGLFAIAFEVPIDTVRVGMGGGKRFEVANVDFWNVASVPDSNKVYDLVYGGKTLVSFVPHNDAFRVSYENVGLKPGTSNIVRGFLVIETTVGTVKQIATKITVGVGGQQLSVNIPQGIDPDKIDERYEQAVFQKEEGHYVFTVTRTDIGGGLVVR
jgi:hypothetical protein